MKEEWKTIPGYDGNYAASTHGRIKRIRPGGGARVGRILRPQVNGCGYYVVFPSYGGRNYTVQLHSLIADTFMPGQRTEGMEVNHKDGNKLNNRVDNLEVITRLENNRHARRNGMIPKSRKGLMGRSSLTVDQVRAIRRNTKLSHKKLAQKYGVARCTIYNIKRYRTWKHVA